MGVDGGAPLVPKDDLHPGALLQHGGQIPVEIGLPAVGAVHVFGEAQYHLVRAVYFDQLDQLVHHHLLPPAVDGGGGPHQKAGGVGQGHAGVGVAVVDGHNAHGIPPLCPPIIPEK